MTITRKINIGKIENLIFLLIHHISHLPCKFKQFWRKKNWKKYCFLKNIEIFLKKINIIFFKLTYTIYMLHRFVLDKVVARLSVHVPCLIYFFFHCTPRILHVCFYGMSKFDLEKRFWFFLKRQIWPENWVLLKVLLVQHFWSPELRVLSFCPISIKFGMNLGLLEQMIFFLNSKFGGLQKSNTQPKSPNSTFQFPQSYNINITYITCDILLMMCTIL